MGKFVVCPKCGYKIYTKDEDVSIVKKIIGSTFELPYAKPLEKKAENAGKPYTNGDICFILLFENCVEARIFLADLLGRTPDAIDYIFRWVDKQTKPEKKFDRRAFNKIKRQIKAAREKLGPLVGIISKKMLMTCRAETIAKARALFEELETQSKNKEAD